MEVTVTRRQLIVAALLVLFGVGMRLAPHLPNFSPLIGIALFSGFYFSGAVRYVVPIGIAVVTDLALGTYALMPLIWASYAGMAFLAHRFQRTGSVGRSITLSLVSAIGFFAISNFAVWLEGMLYPRTFQGLADCFIAAIPFFRTTLLSAVAYTALFFATHTVLQKQTIPQEHPTS